MTRPSWIGHTLGGRYRIDEIVGQGGMSAVYKAYDPNLKRVVAIKMIHTHLADDPKFMVRFEEEATAVAQLRHPNIVQIFDFNHDADLYYMVQEFVAGETLQERLRRFNKTNRRMPLKEVIGYILNICDAAGYAHDRGLVHRDIKPANIMIDVHGQAILMDFGIVKITSGQKHTATGAVIGTAQYLPPEAIRGETPDQRSDQYSLGVTLFEMVSGRPPYEADSAMSLMMMHLNDPLPDMRQLRPEVPAGLVAIIEKTLSKDRAQRYATMADFATALRGVLATLGSPARASTEVDQVKARPAAQSPRPGQTARSVPLPTRPAENTSDGVSSARAAAATSSGGASPPRPTSPAPGPGTLPARTPAASRLKWWPMWVGIPVALGLVLVVVIAAAVRLLGALDIPFLASAATTAPAADQAAQVGLPIARPSLTPTLAQASLPAAGNTLRPSATPTLAQAILPAGGNAPSPSPTPTIPVGVPFARINAITINEEGVYVVEYETFEFQEVIPGQHVHFFFNSVPQENAGHPGSGPWILYGGPRPFEGYRSTDRPPGATHMCIRVANPDHSIELDSGNCYVLPDVNVAIAAFDDPCLAGPGPAYPADGRLSAGQALIVTGISADEAWWRVDNPLESGQTCWLERSRADFSGDLAVLPLAETPPLPEANASGLSVKINQVSLDNQGRYVVAFTPSGFTPALPGTHMHFYFDTFAADQFGSSGNRLMYGGTTPFAGFTQADRPAGAAQMCVLVANPDHTVIRDSGSCASLPDGDQPPSGSDLLAQNRALPLAFQDSFANNDNDWSTGLSNSAQLGSLNRRIEAGRYSWEVNSLQSSAWWAATGQVSAQDFYLAVTTRQVSGPPAGEYGLIFRMNADQDYLVYKISNVGRYALYQFQDSAWTALIDWSDTAALLPGEDNRLEVVAQGDTVSLFLNDELLAQYSPLDLGKGQPGLFVGTSSAGVTGQWEFDDFEVRLPDAGSPGY